MAQLNLDGKSPVDLAIERLRAFEPPEGYYLAFSGGKDSQCIYHLALEAGVKFTAHFQRAVEPPELVRFLKDNYPDVEIHLPAKTMWRLIRERKGFPPSRMQRYCCQSLKEQGGSGRLVVTGVRHAESIRRRARCVVELGKKGTRFLHPIIDWSETDVWEYLNEREIPHCSLYDEGWKRLGCVMCPMSGIKGMARDRKRWPKIAAAYKAAIFDGYQGQYPDIPDAEAVWQWWTTGKLDKGEAESCDGFLFEG